MFLLAFIYLFAYFQVHAGPVSCSGSYTVSWIPISSRKSPLAHSERPDSESTENSVSNAWQPGNWWGVWQYQKQHRRRRKRSWSRYAECLLTSLPINQEIKIRRNVETMACGNLMFFFFLSILRLFEIFHILVASKMNRCFYEPRVLN